LAIDTYVRKILDSPTYVFDEIIDKLIGKNVKNAKIELKRHSTDVDTVLFEAIKSVLKDLKNEEGLVSRFLYNMFGFEIKKNKRREQLIFLGSQLKTQHSNVKAELHRINRQVERLSLSVVDLKRLADGFERKKIYFQNEKTRNKSKFFVSEIALHITKLEMYQLSLESKHNNLEDTEKVYKSLFLKVPRYHELREETHVMLLPPSKKAL